MEGPIYVTRPVLPPFEAFVEGMREIWANEWLTNNGPLLQRYARALEEHLAVSHASLYANGTLALQVAVQALGLTGEVVTTPFTFVATAHALSWNNVTPVFADIEPTHYTLDPAAVEAAITPATTGILAVHVYGHPCDHAGLAAVAERHGLALVYDAAHAFGVQVDGRDIAHLGDVAMFSLHATKLYHTIEGGLLTCADPELHAAMTRLANFGYGQHEDVVACGTNAKMNEFSALMGLQLLPLLPEIIAARREIAETYRARLTGVPGIHLPPSLRPGVEPNYAYVVIEVGDAYPLTRDGLYEHLGARNILARRYFYPLLPDLTCYHGARTADPLVVARRTAARILALPTYATLPLDSVHRICDIIAQAG
jgi:dTDP-4-amino-4,6-dideoxygalactose transaminase